MAHPYIRRALISVHDKTGIVDFARALHEEFGIELISTGGTAKLLKDSGIPVTLVEQVTGFPEMMDGRVKTLHPKIHAAILADRDNPDHMRQLVEQGITPIDMVVVNLYPFEKTIARPDCTFEQAIEMIDIGGPCLLRAAAKNHPHVLVCSDPGLYDADIAHLRAWSDPAIRKDALRSGAFGAFWATTRYDARVAGWLSTNHDDGSPGVRALHLRNRGPLRYGENPHQAAELLKSYDASGPFSEFTASDTANAGGGTLSFNNWLDADAALALCADLGRHGGRASRPGFGGRASEPGSGRRASRPGDEPQAEHRGTALPRVSDEVHRRRHLPHIERPGAHYFLTFTIKDGVLSAEERQIVFDACRYWHGKKMTVHILVVMPTHVHMVVTPFQISPGEWVSLSELLHSIKGYSAKQVNERRRESGALWLEEAWDRIIRNERDYDETVAYIWQNPLKEQLEQPYPWMWVNPAPFEEIVRHEDQVMGRAGASGGAGPGGPASMAGPGGPASMTGPGGPASIAGPRGPAATVVFIKHNNACGVGVADDPVEAYRRAYTGDVNAAMGGILACNFNITPEFADVVMDSLARWGKDKGAGAFFLEVWIAPGFTGDDTVRVIRSRKKWGENVRLLDVGPAMDEPPAPGEMVYRSIAGGILAQTIDDVGLNEDQWQVVTDRAPDDRELADLRLAWLIAKHTKSNAISLCRDGMLIGNGAGQMSRVMSCRIATWLAAENGHADKLAGSVAASDAFFPFRDGPDLLMQAGVTAIIQPGGSKRDADTIAACNERGVAMIFTGTRHFRH